MRTTYPEAYFNFIDVTALTDSKAVALTAKDFADTALLKKDIRQKEYGTMELNQFVLDGSREIFPADAPEDVPYFSDEKSDENRHYAYNPILEITFRKAHSSIGLTLHFASDIPAEIEIIWYTLSGTKLISETFYPDAAEYFCENNVQNYGKITIEFTKSAWPYRYAKLDYIEYGRMWLLGTDNIKAASVYEELDITGATLSINTAQIDIIDTDNRFELSNHDGLWKAFQKEQRIAITEFVNGRPVDCGSFYLDDWSCQKNIVKFAMVDIIGLMDKTQYYGGTVYKGEPAGNIIDSIMDSCGVKEYSVEEEIRETRLSGWLGIMSHRQALQQVVFACGAVADCSRIAGVRIYRPDRYVSHTIGLDRKFQGTKITLLEYVSAVRVAFYDYVPEEKESQISKSILPAGRTKVEFKNPFVVESIQASAGSIVEKTENYAVISMEQSGECILSGRKYEEKAGAYTTSVQHLEAGETAKTKEYKGCTLMDLEKAKEVAEYILDYLQLRQEIDMRYINEGECVGNWCNVEQTGGGQSMTGITGQTLDLTGGNLASAKCRGYSRTATSDYFAGGELYAGEEGIV